MQSRNDYYAVLGIPPGPPTAKAIYVEAEYSGKYGDYTITPLGNYDVPTGWPMKPYKRPYGGTPGPPVMYEKPSDPEEEGAGYGFSNGMSQQERDVFFYHPDHLGSSSFITNIEGEVVQHIEYVPYGEVFIEERNNVWNTPYLFNAKEFDEETGLYYYGARYYDARLAMWYGVDALAEEYPNMGGYVYCVGNPVKLVDPDGRKIKGFSVNDNGEVICDESIASSDAKDMYNKASKTKTGKQAFVDMINADTNIELRYSNEATEYNGLTDGDEYNSETGLYESATITIYRKNIESDVSDDQGRFASSEEGIIATVVHESIHLSKDQIKLDREYGRKANKKRHRALYYLLEQNTMNKEYKAVKDYREVTGSNSTKGYDRYKAEKDCNGVAKPNFTNSKDYPNIIKDLKGYKR